MENSELSEKKDKQVLKNGTDFDILCRDETFWQQTVKDLAGRTEILSDVDITVAQHPERVFCIYCKCSKCLTFRKLLIGIHVENQAYNNLWDKLKEIIVSYYSMLPNDQDTIVVNRKYRELQSESCGIRWVSDGSIDVKKNFHVSMGNDFHLSNEMTFIIVFNMLYTRDRHQLFELLCLQLTSIILAYREGIKEMTKCVEEGGEEFYKPEEFLNYILNGYERITEIADTLTPLVIEMRDHLQTFSLTWQLMNQCMYYRFLYVDIESRMAECILRLKDAVDAETYKNFVMRFIKFDEEMQQVGQVWEVSLVALDLFRKSTPEQLARVERIMMIQDVTKSLKELKDIPEVKEVPPALALDWIVSSENEEVWLGVLNLLREKCDKKQSCSCWACLMSKRNSTPDNCETSETNDGEKEAEDVYHLAHAVFKHLKDREVYSKPRVSPENFCVFSESPCNRLECSVATNLIVGSYPLSFTKFLLRTYQPLSTEDREKYLKVPSQSLIRKFCLKKGGAAAKEIMQEADEINHSFLLLNMFWDDDDIADPILRAGLAAALAENFKIEVKLPQKHIIFSYFYALFRVVEADLAMDDEWLEKVNVANLFKSFGVVVNEPPPVDAIEMTLNELKITADVSSGNSNALDLVQFSMKEVADKLSSISLTDDKAVLENEIKKPLVEALKLAASNKKLEAELKSLQKEHNMLKDMVKGLEQIHGEKKEVQVTVEPTKCGHSHGSPSTPEKDSADCVCYYCTLFGKNQDLMNTRSTETRDRLRKRLHSLQNQGKSKNLKNISLLLKNEKQQQQQVTAPAVPSTPPQHKCSASMKMKVELELQQRAAKKKVPAPVAKNPPVAVKIQRATEINLKSLENLVEYIEGPTSRAVVEHKKAEEIKAKKEQKKQRQVDLKIRRQIDLSLEKLEKINGELQEVVTDAKQISNQLSQLKAGKGKVKKVETTEEKLTELNGRKAKLESETRFIVGEIKDLSGNVDFARECGEMKAILGVLGITPAPAAKVKVVQPPQPRLLQQIKIDTSDDPAKRMVTIRRINLPHAEPQVTVTAKGTTPDMDQLLYTFVNGQLVPASSLSPSAFQNGSIQLFMSSNGQTKMVVGNHGQDLSQIKTLNIKEDLHPVPAPVNKKKTEKSVKKELKKKKEEIMPPPAIPALVVVKKEVKKQTEVVKAVEKPKKKLKKAYIDPEFAANPFKLLDEEGQPSESEEEEIVEPVKKVEVPEPVKVVKEKKPKKEKKVKGPERKDSVTSVASSNASKESKQNLPIENFVVQPSRFTSATKPIPMNSSSIMDQLNRGVRVEGLRLPPGITLTKVAPGESMAGKRESINRLAKPLQDFSSAPPPSHKEQNGIIMVESAPLAEAAAPAGKKKNKKKKPKQEEKVQKQQKSQPDRMVTLKNPMFGGNPTEPMNSMMRNLQTPPFVSPLAPSEPQTASIIRNENGMYTIRNPSFQNAFTGGATAPSITPRPQMDPIARPTQFQSQFEDTQPKCSSVIGSEMKNARRYRTEQEMAANMQYGMRQPAGYSHFGGPGMNFNTNGTHCDDGFGGGSGCSTGFPSYYDDLRLQPGQMLNSEVTIHNVTESKMFQNQAKKTPPPIGTPRNGNVNVDAVGTLFGDLLISRPMAPTDVVNGEWMNPKKQNSTNSNSPISVNSLDDPIFDGTDSKLPSSFYHNNFSDEKSSGASSLFSSGM